MKKITFLILSVFMTLGAWADEVKMDRTAWTVTATAAPASAIEGDNDGRVTAMLDGVNNTFFHSDWSGSASGKGCPLAFQVDMSQEETLTKVTLLPRQDADAGAPTSWRIYVSNTSVDLTTIAQADRATALSVETLGVATLSGTWEYTSHKDLQTATFETPATGRYILFVADDTRASNNNWLCVAEFNAYHEAASYKVTYDYYVGETRIGTSGELVVEAGAAYPDLVLPSGMRCSADYYSLEAKPEGTVAANQTVNIAVTQNLPFAVSASYADATWYALTLTDGKYYLGYEEGQESIPLNRQTTEFADADLFCFVGNVMQGFQIYNKAAGEGKVMSSSSNPYDGNTGGNTFVTLQDKGASGMCQAWDVTKGSAIGSKTGFYMGMHGLAAEVRMNNRGSKVAFWNSGAGTGSTFLVSTPVSALSDAIAATEDLDKGALIGQYNAEAVAVAVAKAQAALDAADRTVASLVAAKGTLTTDLAAALNMPVAGKTYQIVSAYPEYEKQQGVKKAMYADGEAFKWATLDGSNYAYYWLITPNANGTYKVAEYTDETKCMSGTGTIGETAADITLAALGSHQFNLKNGGETFHTNGHSSGAGTGSNIVSWGGGANSASAWYIVETEDPQLASAKAALENKVNALKAYEYGVNPGYYPAESEATVTEAVAEAEGVLTGGSEVAKTYQDALTELNTATEGVVMIPVSEGKYYIINGKTAFAKGKAMTSLAERDGSKFTPGWEDYNQENPEQVWTLTASGEFFTLKNEWAGKYITKDVEMRADSASLAKFVYLGKGQFRIKLNEGKNNDLHANHHGYYDASSLTEWNGDANSPSAWYLVAVTADEAALAQATFQTLKAKTPEQGFQNVEGAVIVKANEIGDIATINAAIAAVNAIDPETATVAEMGACYAANTATINSLTAYGSLTDIVYTLEPGFATMCLPCWGGYGSLTTDEFQVYSCTEMEGNVLTLTATSSMAPKTPFIVENKTAENIVFEFIGWNKLDGENTTFTSGLLAGTVEDMEAPMGSYVLQENDGIRGFYLVDSVQPTVGAYHCWLNLSTSENAPKFVGFGGQATGINEVAVEAAQNGKYVENGQIVIVKNGVKYNVAGQRL